MSAQFRDGRDPARSAGAGATVSAPSELAGANSRFAVVAARTNADVVLRLLEGCVETLKRHGATEDRIEVFQVPGAFELPFGARAAARTGRFQAVIALGAVIRGGTPHFEFICAETARGIMNVGLETGVPTLFGVLTTNNRDDALERAGGTSGNKGAEAALAAIEMANLSVGKG
ncbi:MAG: 6,7-dimethyl-8-ribityllumazine synthase [bacterium]